MKPFTINRQEFKMIPNNVKQFLESCAPFHFEMLNKAWAARVSLENTNASLPKIEDVEHELLIKMCNSVIEIVPNELSGDFQPSFTVKLNSVTHQLEVLVELTVVALEACLKKHKAIMKIDCNIVDESDCFTYNGTRDSVSHEVNVNSSGKQAGAYISYTLVDSSVFTVVMSPEEVSAASLIWNETVLGSAEAFTSTIPLVQLIVTIRSLKTLSSNGVLEDNSALESLVTNFDTYYRGIFSEFENSKSNGLAPSVVGSRAISSQVSKIDAAINKMVPVAKKQKNNVIKMRSVNDSHDDNSTDLKPVEVTEFGEW